MHMPMPITRFVLMLAALGASVALTGGSATAGRTAPAPDPRAAPLGAPLLAPQIAGDEKWLPGGTANGLNGWSKAFVVDSVGNLYAGGSINLAGNVPVRNIAKWDGGAWSSLGYGVTGSVSALAWDSLHNWLYVGGTFTSICMNADCSITNPAHNIARWEPAGGGSWHTLQHGLSGEVTALALDDAGNLYAGGAFASYCLDQDCRYLGPTLNNIAKWNPSGAGTWFGLGGGVTSSGYSTPVRALAWWTGPYGNVMIVGGDLTAAGGAPMNQLAYWAPAGSAWHSFYGGVDGSVATVVTVPSPDNSVIVGGGFLNVCGTMPPGCGTLTRVNHLAVWRGGAALEGVLGGTNHEVRSLSVDAAHQRIYIGGLFSDLCGDSNCTWGVGVQHVVRWDYAPWPGTWSFLGTGVDGYGEAVAWNGAANLLYVGGTFFNTAGGVGTTGIAKWDGAAWSSVGSGDGPGPRVLAVAADGKGRVYVGGLFRAVGNVLVNHIAVWDSKTQVWSPLDYGVNGMVNALLVDPAGNLYAGGEFTALCGNPSCTTYGTAVKRIAKWDPVSGTWSGLNWGVGYMSEYAQVLALALDHNNHLYVGGTFKGFCPDGPCATTSPAHNVAVWNIGTSTWSAVGVGMRDSVRALAVDQDNNVYAGGTFTYLCGDSNCTVDGVKVNYIAKWTPGGSWSAVGTGMDKYVNALTVDHDNALYAAGLFQYLCSAPGCTGNTKKLSGIAKWTGAGGGSWSAVGNGVDGFVYALLVDDWNNLFVGGVFATLCGDPDCLTAGTVVNNIAEWYAPGGWSALGSGIGPARNASVFALGYFHGMLSAGGSFGTTGDKVAANFGRYNYGVYLSVPMVMR